jgi:type II secretory pathway component GspD/PulD (secretin)
MSWQMPAQLSGKGRHMSIHKIWSTILISCAALLMSGLLIASDWAISSEDIDLHFFINTVADELGLPPIKIDPEVRGTLKFLIRRPVAKEDVLPLFQAVLKSNNAAFGKYKGIYQIVPISSAEITKFEFIDKIPETSTQKSGPNQSPANTGEQKQSGSPRDPLVNPTTQGSVGKIAKITAASDKDLTGNYSQKPRFVTYIVQATVPVKDLIETIKPFISNGGVIMPFERMNILILTDYPDSAARIMQIIRSKDSNPAANDSHIGD